MFDNIPIFPIIAALLVFVLYIFVVQFVERKEKIRKRLGKIVEDF
jgi:uncharacterized membrane protein YcaP (DUF421 family)